VVRGTPPLAGKGLTADFRGWLQANGYGAWGFPRDDLEGGSYGGRSAPAQGLSNQPVVFVHGNSDRAAGRGADGPAGWTAVIRQFLARGYSPAELYATTWGPADPARATEQVHSPRNVRRIRAFLEAVLAYTGAERIDVIAHSMGVTLARRAILGGEMDGYALGPPLTGRVDAFVGIAGANLGLTACFFAESQPTCSDEDGLFPGYPSWLGAVGESDFLQQLNARTGYEGARVYSIWSRADQLIGLGGLVYGEYTSRIPGQDGEKVYSAYPYGHFCVRDLSADVQLRMIRGGP
jgi:pimeloyl-ACP methyl ester carboxylesterase